MKTMTLANIRLNPLLMNYEDEKRGYIFSGSLANRSRELSEAIRTYRAVIWPLIVKREDELLVDGYARYSALKAMGIQKCYVYYGTL